jgi:hypothetical protein
VILRSRGGLAEAKQHEHSQNIFWTCNPQTFHADKFKSFLKSKKFVSHAESNPRASDPRVPEPKRSPLAIFNAACPSSSEFLVKVTFVSTRSGILRSRRILNHAKPSITAGGMKILFYFFFLLTSVHILNM